jgi:hypothetical protein
MSQYAPITIIKKKEKEKNSCSQFRAEHAYIAHISRTDKAGNHRSRTGTRNKGIQLRKGRMSITKLPFGKVAHACHSSYSGDGGREIMVPGTVLSEK